MELFHKNLFLKEAHAMQIMADGRLSNDLNTLIDKLERDRDQLLARIKAAS